MLKIIEFETSFKRAFFPGGYREYKKKKYPRYVRPGCRRYLSEND